MGIIDNLHSAALATTQTKFRGESKMFGFMQHIVEIMTAHTLVAMLVDEITKLHHRRDYTYIKTFPPGNSWGNRNQE